MTHDFNGCTDADCQICAAYVRGCEDTCGLLLFVRNNGIPSGLGLCQEPCEHGRCALIWTLDFAYRAVAAKAHGDAAAAWEKSHPLLASQVSEVMTGSEPEAL